MQAQQFLSYHKIQIHTSSYPIKTRKKKQQRKQQKQSISKANVQINRKKKTIDYTEIHRELNILKKKQNVKKEMIFKPMKQTFIVW